VIEQGHTWEVPRLRRVYPDVDAYPVFWEFAAESILPDVLTGRVARGR
jgi:hypothetical protein